jgi:two-component system NtrC family sensor kinase
MAKLQEKILVVDDDPQVLDLIAEQVLKPQGYQVATAQDGNTALKFAMEMKPDILIVSLEIPGLSGKDLLAALRTQESEATVIATGPKGSETQMMQALRLGAKDYLTKPLREAELVSSIDHALTEVKLRRQREELATRLAGANQQLERRVKELSTLYNIGKAVTSSTELSQLFGTLIEGALYVTEAEVGWLSLRDEGAEVLILRAVKGLPLGTNIKVNQPWDDGLSSFLLMSGEPMTLAGEPLTKMRAGQVAKAAAAVPIKAKEQVMGVIAVGNKSGRPFTERDQAMLSAVADYASIALVNARLFQALEERARTLQQSYDALAIASSDHKAVAVLQNAAREMAGPLGQARSISDHLLRGGGGTLTPQLVEALRASQERLDVLNHMVEHLATLSAPAPS